MNMHVKPPGEAQDALYRRTDIAPEIFFQALGRVRKEAADEIERLITWLDSTIDVDEDSAIDDEGCDDPELEFSLGSLDRLSNQIKAWQCRGWGDVDCELDTSDAEPSLGSIAVHELRSQADWAAAGSPSDDRENDTSDLEPSLCGHADEAGACGDDRDLEGDDSDQEPSLGWTVDGCISNTGANACDTELSDHLPVAVVQREARGVTVEDSGYGGRKVIRNLTEAQQEALAPRIDRASGVSTDKINTRGLL